MTIRHRICTASLAVVLGSVSPLLSGQAAIAQDFAPVAIVNDQIITGFDVTQRAQLNATAAGGSGTDLKKALEELIADTLRIQAARRAGIDPPKEEVRAGFDEIARLNQRDPAQMRNALLSRGITAEALDTQIKAEVAWRALILQRYASRARVSESDVEELINDTTSATNESVSFELAQLVIGVPPQAPQAVADAALARALSVRSGISSCADITAKQSQFLPISGNLGTLTPATMPGAVREAVANLDKGQITQPVRSNDGFHVIMVCEKTEGGAIDDARREQAVNTIRSQRLERYARSLLRELKREAIIERR